MRDSILRFREVSRWMCSQVWSMADSWTMSERSFRWFRPVESDPSRSSTSWMDWTAVFRSSPTRTSSSMRYWPTRVASVTTGYRLKFAAVLPTALQCKRITLSRKHWQTSRSRIRIARVRYRTTTILTSTTRVPITIELIHSTSMRFMSCRSDGERDLWMISVGPTMLSAAGSLRRSWIWCQVRRSESSIHVRRRRSLSNREDKRRLLRWRFRSWEN